MLEVEIESQSSRSPGGRSATVRGRVFRASSGVAVVVVMLLLLALAATWESSRAARALDESARHRLRAGQAELLARRDQRRALVAEARATRAGQTIDRREVALERLERAAAIEPSEELRDEVLAAIALPGQQGESSFALGPWAQRSVFSADLRRCAINHTNGNLIIYRLSDSHEVQRFDHPAMGVPAEQGLVQDMAFSASDDALVVRFFRGAMSVLDLGTGRARFVRDAERPGSLRPLPVLSRDGKVVLIPLREPDGWEVADAKTGRTLRKFPGWNTFTGAALRPGHNEFVWYDRPYVRRIDWSSGQELDRYDASDGARLMTWSDDGELLAVVGDAPVVRVLNLGTGVWQELSGTKSYIFQIQFDPTGQFLSTVMLDGGSRIWNVPEGRTIGVSADHYLSRWADDGRTGWIARKKLMEVRAPVDRPEFRSLAGREGVSDRLTMDVSPDGNWAVTLGAPTNLFVWNLNREEEPRRIPVRALESFSFHPLDSRLLLIRKHELSECDFIVESGTGAGSATVRLGTPVPVATKYRHEGQRATYSEDGRTLLHIDRPKGEVWVERRAPSNTLAQMREIYVNSIYGISLSTRSGNCAALSPDGRRAVVAYDGRSGAWLYDAETGKELKQIDSGYGVAQYSPDGAAVVLATADDCRYFRTSDWTRVWTRPAQLGSRGHLVSAAISGDGRYIAYVESNRRLALLEADSGRELAHLETSDGSDLSVIRWTRDGRRLVVATQDNHLDVWQPAELRDRLVTMGLDFGRQAVRGLGTAETASIELGATVPRWIVPTLLGGAVIAAVLALALLFNHRTLVSEVSEKEALASQREKELRIEREVGELKSRFVSMVSHEFRTPLGITMSAVELLRHHLDILPQSQREQLCEDIFSSTRHMAGLMEQVLLLGRVEAGKMTFRREPIQLEAFCQKLVDESHSATQRDTPIHLQIDGDFAGAAADESLLRLIFGNLLSNAVKYSPEGSAVEFRLEREGGMGVFTVTDHGIGIPREEQARMYQPFHRAANVGAVPGTGLGLVIVKRCVELHKGTIGFESEPGQGTAFHVRIPLY